MFIHDMTEAECRIALKQAKVGRIACAQNNQPYVVPLYFAYDDHHLYFFSTVGQKIEWMRVNPLVCVEVDNIASPDEWMSVVVFGRYEELPDVSRFKRARQHAFELLQSRSVWWWEPACTRENHRDTPHSDAPVVYRIHIDRMTGHHATPDIVQPSETYVEATPVGKKWFGLVRRAKHQSESKARKLS